MKNRRRLARAVMVVALVGSAIVLPSTAGADRGDGREACNYGEICLHDFNFSERYRKHFWWSGSHTNYTWWDAVDNHWERESVRNNADSIRNRDTMCDVKVIDDRGHWRDDVFVADNNNVNLVIHSNVDGENDRHERC